MIIAISEILHKYFNWQQLGIYLPLKREVPAAIFSIQL